MYFLSATVFVVVTVLNLLVRWWLKRTGRLPAVIWRVRLVGLIILHIGVVLVMWSANSLDQSLGRTSRPVVRAYIVKAEIAGDRNYQPEITYRYTVDGEQYTGTSDLQAPGFGGKRKRWDTANGLLEDYQPGDSIYVFYNPVRPSESAFTYLPTWDVYVKFATGVLLFACGFFMALLPRKAR